MAVRINGNTKYLQGATTFEIGDTYTYNFLFKPDFDLVNGECDTSPAVLAYFYWGTGASGILLENYYIGGTYALYFQDYDGGGVAQTLPTLTNWNWTAGDTVLITIMRKQSATLNGGSNYIEFYLNGVLASGITTQPAVHSGAKRWDIGNYFADTARDMQSDVQIVSLYNRTFTAADLATLMAAKGYDSTWDADLIFKILCATETGAVTTEEDQSANNNDFTGVGSVEYCAQFYSPSPPVITYYPNKLLLGAYDVDGTTRVAKSVMFLVIGKKTV